MNGADGSNGAVPAKPEVLTAIALEVFIGQQGQMAGHRPIVVTVRHSLVCQSGGVRLIQFGIQCGYTVVSVQARSLSIEAPTRTWIKSKAAGFGWRSTFSNCSRSKSR